MDEMYYNVVLEYSRLNPTQWSFLKMFLFGTSFYEIHLGNVLLNHICMSFKRVRIKPCVTLFEFSVMKLT